MKWPQQKFMQWRRCRVGSWYSLFWVRWSFLGMSWLTVRLTVTRQIECQSIVTENFYRLSESTFSNEFRMLRLGSGITQTTVSKKSGLRTESVNWLRLPSLGFRVFPQSVECAPIEKWQDLWEMLGDLCGPLRHRLCLVVDSNPLYTPSVLLNSTTAKDTKATWTICSMWLKIGRALI
jgi:hypothetical protein